MPDARFQDSQNSLPNDPLMKQTATIILSALLASSALAEQSLTKPIAKSRSRLRGDRRAGRCRGRALYQAGEGRRTRLLPHHRRQGGRAGARRRPEPRRRCQRRRISRGAPRHAQEPRRKADPRRKLHQPAGQDGGAQLQGSLQHPGQVLRLGAHPLDRHRGQRHARRYRRQLAGVWPAHAVDRQAALEMEQQAAHRRSPRRCEGTVVFAR